MYLEIPLLRNRNVDKDVNGILNMNLVKKQRLQVLNPSD